MHGRAAGAAPRPRYHAAPVAPTGPRTPRESRGNVKAEIHPEYVVSQVTCTCGNEFTLSLCSTQTFNDSEINLGYFNCIMHDINQTLINTF